MNGKHRNKYIYQIVAIILCITTLATSGVLHNFSNIFATDNTNSSEIEISTEKFTWRETTAARNLYIPKFDVPFVMGQDWAGENCDELIQMYNDPSVEIDLDQMFKGTIYEGFSIDDFEILKNEGYNDLVKLANDLAATGKNNVIEYVFGMSLLADEVEGAHVTAMYGDSSEWGGANELECYLPSTGKSYKTNDTYYQAKAWGMLGVGEKPAICLDPGMRYSSGQMFTATDASSASSKIQNAVRWLAEDFEDGSSTWKTKYKYVQLFSWAVSAAPGASAAALEQRWRDLYCEYWTSLWLINNGKIYTTTIDGESVRAFKKSEYDAKLLEAKSYTVVTDRMDTWYPIMTEYSGSIALYVYHNGDSSWQRLITWQVPEPPPEEKEIEPVTATEYVRNKLYVKHNIRDTINSNTGEGEVGYWTSEWGTSYRGNPDTLVCVCGQAQNCTHTTEDLNFYTKNENEADLSVFDDNHYYPDGTYGTGPAPTYVEETYYGDPWTSLKLVEYPAHYVLDVTYTTFSNHACEPSDGTKTHSISEPVIENYTLTLHYQGGWFNGSTGTQFMNGNTYGLTFENTRDDYNLAKDVVTTETTNVQFNSMEVTESYLFDPYTTTSAYSAGTLVTGYSGGTFTHSSTNDAVSSIIEFTYKNSYVVSLPTPVRTGYNFLGWFDAPEDGNQIIPTTVTNKDGTFNNAYVISEDKTFYAYWELITKDETFTIEWLDNSNNYTTRPSAVYIELYRYPVGYPEEVDLCKGYITERLNTSTADWIYRFSNETGISNKGSQTASTLKTVGIHDPNDYEYNYSTGAKSANTENNIFKAGTRYYIKISGDNLNPAGSNTWTVTLKDLQKFDTSKNWVEYEYVIKEITCESLDDTTQYYVSPNSAHNTYNTSLDSYYNIKNNTANNSGQKTLAQYNALDIPTNFSHTIVNRAANVANPLNWKNVSVTVTFKDGPVDNYDDDIYHFRPYSVKIELYQNYAYGKDENSDNYLTDRGVRVLFDREDNPKILTHTDNPYSATIPSSGFLANTLMWTFENVPTVQDNTCIKIAYDVVLTHGQDRYRYTIDTDSNAYNLTDSMASSHYYANKHKTDINTITDLDYTKLTDGTTTLTVIDTIFGSDGVTPDYTKLGTNQVFKCDLKETMEDINTDYEFVEDNFNDIYQSKLNHEDFTLSNNNQNNRYNDGTTATKASYLNAYQSMAYNMRYYYIDEERSMRANITQNVLPLTAPVEKKIEYLFYKETLYWNFTLTLNHPETKLPTEYSGSESSDDRTGIYNGSDNDDFMHTKNTLVISNKIYAEKDQTTEVNKYGTTAKNNKYDYYDNLITDAGNESFLITLKQVEKSWDNSGHDTVQSYNDSKYSKNGYKSTSYNDANGNMTINFVSNASANASSFNEYEEIGNEYNIQLPAHGTVVIDYIPDGRYEVTCHYDIDFDYYTMTMTNGTVKFEQGGNEKWYITISSTEQISTGDFLHKATIDYWRGYVNDENEILSYKTTIKISDKNSWLNGEKNGFNVKENFDEEHPTAFAPDDYWDDYLVPNYKPTN